MAGIPQDSTQPHGLRPIIDRDGKVVGMEPGPGGMRFEDLSRDAPDEASRDPQSRAPACGADF